MIAEPITTNDLEIYTYEYWSKYYLALNEYINEYKKELDKTSKVIRFLMNNQVSKFKHESNYLTSDVHIEFNYDVEFYNEKLATLYGEADRVKTIMSVLKYGNTFDTYPITLQSSMNNG